MQYSIWILSEGKAQETLAGVIHRLAKKYQGPIFEPHLTLLSPIPEKKEVVIEKAVEIAKSFSPYKLTTTSIDYGTTYFQCVFVRVKATKPLIETAMLTQKLFGINKLFIPHITLFYGNVDLETRKKNCEGNKLIKFKF